jgi:hypothetical protein
MGLVVVDRLEGRVRGRSRTCSPYARGGGQQQSGQAAAEQAQDAAGGQRHREHGEHAAHRGQVDQPGVSAGLERACQQRRPEMVELQDDPLGATVLDPDGGEAPHRILRRDLDVGDARAVEDRVLQGGGPQPGDGDGVGHVGARVLADAVGEPGEEQHGRDQRHPGQRGQPAPVGHQPRPPGRPPGHHRDGDRRRHRQRHRGRQAVAAGIGERQPGPCEQADPEDGGQQQHLAAVDHGRLGGPGGLRRRGGQGFHLRGRHRRGA